MRILYLDREFKPDGKEPSFKCAVEAAQRYKSFLEARGHDVKIYRFLSDLGLGGIRNYELIIAHPLSDDSMIIREELKIRPALRFILQSPYPEDHGFPEASDRITRGESSRVIAYPRIPRGRWEDMKDELANLVEKGWA